MLVAAAAAAAASVHFAVLCMHANLLSLPSWVTAAAAMLCSMQSAASYAPARLSALIFVSSMLQLSSQARQAGFSAALMQALLAVC